MPHYTHTNGLVSWAPRRRAAGGHPGTRQLQRAGSKDLFQTGDLVACHSFTAHDNVFITIVPFQLVAVVVVWCSYPSWHVLHDILDIMTSSPYTLSRIVNLEVPLH